MIGRRERPQFVRYSLAFITPLLVALVMAATWPLFAEVPFGVVLIPVIITAWYGGLLPGLLSLSLSFLITTGLFVAPYYSFSVGDLQSLVRILVIGVSGVLVCVVCELLHRERRRAEKHLAAATVSEGQFQTMTNTIPQLAWMAHADGHIYWYNDQWYEYTGTTLEEMEGWGWKSVHDAEVLPEVMKRWERAIETGEPFEMTFPLRRADGEFRNFLTRVQPLKDASGKVISWFGTNTDVDELQHLERAAGESESRYRTLFDRAPDGIVIANAEGSYIDANETICRMLGYTREEMLSLHVSDVTTPEEAQYIQPAFDEVRSTKDYRREWVLKRKDGSTFTADVVATEMPDGSAIGIIRDITERRRVDAELHKERERLEGVIGSAMDAIVSINEEQKIVLFNTAAEKMFGVAAADAIGQQLDRFIPERFRGGHRAHVENFGQTNVTRRSMRSFSGLFGLRSDGEEFPIEASLSQIKSDGKKTYTAIIRDVTERQRSMWELERSEERYRDLVENAHDIIYSHDLDGNYTSINSAGERITGYTREEALKLNMMHVVAPDHLELAREMLAAKLKGDETTSYELDIVAKDGRRIALEVNSKLIRHDGVAVAVLGIARDVSARKQMQEQLRQSQKMEAIGQLAGGIAHDFNNLLTVIMGYSELLVQVLPHDDPKRRHIESIHQAGERAASLTNQLLAFSRKAVIQPVPVSINYAVRDTEKMLRRLIGENIDLSLSLDESIGQILVDPGQLNQVFVNLVVNARDAMPEGGKVTVQTFSSRIGTDYVSHHPYAQEGDYVVLSVTDTGHGIPPETRARIFEPFFTTKEHGKGTGLGLATVYGIVQQAGGHIEVYSEIEAGTAFKAYFPAITASLGREVADEKADLAYHGTETILVVEDEEMVRELAVRALRDFGYNTLAAGDPSEAIKVAAKNGDINLLFTDVVMPGSSGPELAKILTERRPTLKVLFASGYTDDAVVRHGMLEAGMNFLQKPYSTQALGKKIREILDGKD